MQKNSTGRSLNDLLNA